MWDCEQLLQRLQRSAFRSSFHLKQKDRDCVLRYGYAGIRRHAEDFIRKRMAPAFIPNDGKQTPMRNHPVFIAQHACACCCRSCLFRWYRIPRNVELTAQQQEDIVNLLMLWIRREMAAYSAGVDNSHGRSYVN
ncbi:MAG: DUF4186 domain-containing protein [Desulfovibrionaceae bacterium]|nr:DUF4186 domain-containing protein [Desulfovibrionaceae bacterium]